MPSAKELVARRSDLSTFLVHFTRNHGNQTAAQNLGSIVALGRIEARSPFGMAKGRLAALAPDHPSALSQHSVCFTETPLEYSHLLFGETEGRTIQLQPYGIAITKKAGRRLGINPVWYLDMTPGHDWLTNSVNSLLDPALQTLHTSPIGKLTPFIEQMGTWGPGNKKEFWWEREWRAPFNVQLAARYIGLCPEPEIPAFEDLARTAGRPAPFIDPRWGLEQIIGKLAGIPTEEVGPF